MNGADHLVELTLPIGALLNLGVILLQFVWLVRILRKVSRLEKLITPTKQTAEGTRYYAPLSEEQQEFIDNLRIKRKKELRDMEELENHSS